jgi:hypothetical protein
MIPDEKVGKRSPYEDDDTAWGQGLGETDCAAQSSVAIVVGLNQEPPPRGSWLAPAPIAMSSGAVEAGRFQIPRKRWGST